MLELRPSWCLDDKVVHEVFDLGPWLMPDGSEAVNSDADAWIPGSVSTLCRTVALKVDPRDMERLLNIHRGDLGFVARWSCAATSTAGVHVGGPTPSRLGAVVEIRLEVDGTVARSIEIETGLVSLRTANSRITDGAPHGAMVWSDSCAPGEKKVIHLEGDEFRLPVKTVSFDERFEDGRSALWAIDLSTPLQPDDLVANVVTVLLNKDILEREFADRDGKPDATKIPPSLLAAVQVDLVRSLVADLIEELSDLGQESDHDYGTVGGLLTHHLNKAFGGDLEAASAMYRHEHNEFTRALWSALSPDQWRI